MLAFQKTTLPNGLRVLTERHDDVASVTLGLWIVAGSIYEDNRQRGLAHLLEHMVFKGTQNRSMAQIAAQMDTLGGQMNAFTEREYVCYHVKVLSEDAPKALELLCDLVSHPLLDESHLEVEKGVVLEEIRAVEDAPEEMVEDLFLSTLWTRSRWGRPILGTPACVSRFGAKDLREFMARHYGPPNVVVVAVGDVDHEKIVKRAEKLLCDLPGDLETQFSPPPEPKVTAHHVQLARETEGAHLIIGTRAYRYDDPRRFAAWALDSILTGGYSSRLFQEIREKRGLCYNISSMSACYRAAGFWAVETSVAPEMAHQTASLIGKELRKIKKNGVTKSELKRAKQMARVNLLLAEESSSAQMGRIARNELYFGRQKSTEETLLEVESVSLEQVQCAANEMFVPELMNFAAVGPFAEGEAPLEVDVG